jgi:pimeloyl-ACP methyl ester carboxylesterase
LTSPTDKTTPYDDRFVELGGLRFHYTEWPGPADAVRTVLMVHGLNEQLHTWDPIAAPLAEQYRIALIDLRGHGESEWARDGYTVDKFVEDLHRFVDFLDAGPVDYVGHSLGARVGIAFAAEYPGDVASLVLSDTGPEVPRSGAKEVQRKVGSAGEVKGFRTEADALAHFREMYPEWQPEFHDLHVRYQLRRNWADKLVFRSDPDMFWITGSVSLREVPYLWGAAGRIRAHTLIARGRRSYLLDDEIARRMLEVIPHADEITFDTGHYVPREAPVAFTEALLDFIGHQDAPGSASESRA